MPKPEEYIGIREWGKEMGSHSYYIVDQQAKAAEANAPLDAIFESYVMAQPTGRWSTVSELAPDHSFHAVYQRALRKAGRVA
jgi:hypothetical protein